MLVRKQDGFFDKDNPAEAKIKERFLRALGCENDFRNPSWPLQNLKETSETDFWGNQSHYGMKASAWCGSIQVEGIWKTLLVYFDDHGTLLMGGFAVLVSRDWPAKPTKFFTWCACDHKFNSRNTGNCLNLYTCVKCGENYEVDSSG